MENISLFQLLILLFIFYPLIRRFLDGMRGEQEPVDDAHTGRDPWSHDPNDPASQGEMREDHTSNRSRDRSGTVHSEAGSRTSTDPNAGHTHTGEQSWEDFFEGLEEVLAGKDPHDRTGSQHPSGTQQPADSQTASGSLSRDSARSTGAQTASRPIPPPEDRDSSGAYRHPSHGPVFESSSDTPQKVSRRSTPVSLDDSRSKYSRQDDATTGVLGDEVSRELTATDNPIYTELDEVPEVAVIGRSAGRNVKMMIRDTEKLKDGILLKEILDKPRSRRPHPYRF